MKRLSIMLMMTLFVFSFTIPSVHAEILPRPPIPPLQIPSGQEYFLGGYVTDTFKLEKGKIQLSLTTQLIEGNETYVTIKLKNEKGKDIDNWYAQVSSERSNYTFNFHVPEDGWYYLEFRDIDIYRNAIIPNVTLNHIYVKYHLNPVDKSEKSEDETSTPENKAPNPENETQNPDNETEDKQPNIPKGKTPNSQNKIFNQKVKPPNS